MSNGHYLIVSYFVVAFVSLCLGLAAYRALRRPFAAIAEAVAGSMRSRLLKRALALSVAMAALLGFLSVSYRGCDMSYEQIVKDRGYLVQKNREQLQHAGNCIAYVVLAWGVVVVVCLVVLRRNEDGEEESPRD